MTSESASWRPRHVITSKKCVMASKTRHDVKGRHDVQNTSWRQNVHHDVQNTPWRQKVRDDVQNTSWRQKMRHDVQDTSWRPKVRHDVQNTLWRPKNVMTSKNILSRPFSANRQPTGFLESTSFVLPLILISALQFIAIPGKVCTMRQI